MSQTNTGQYQSAKIGVPSHGGSCGTHRGNRNGSCGNSRFTNSSFVQKLTKNCIFHISITKGGPQSIQPKKILKALPDLCQDRHYDYIPDIVSTNTKLTQEYVLSNHPIKRWCLFRHYVKLGIVNPIIVLDVWK